MAEAGGPGAGGGGTPSAGGAVAAAEVEEDLQIHPRYSSLLETQRLCKEAIQ